MKDLKAKDGRFNKVKKIEKMILKGKKRKKTM
jgi:hypothetical protein